MRPMRPIRPMQVAIRAHLGPVCCVVEPVELEAAFSNTQPGTPIVLISSTDQPLPQLMQFAEAKGVKVGVLIHFVNACIIPGLRVIQGRNSAHISQSLLEEAVELTQNVL